jgi:hypothetical protein
MMPLFVDLTISGRCGIFRDAGIVFSYKAEQGTMSQEEQERESYERIMDVVAHPDDMEFSAGGTVAKLANEGKHVTLIQVTSGNKGTDRFRIKITRSSDDVVVYDTKMGTSDDMDLADPLAIGGGSIVIHKAK